MQVTGKQIRLSAGFEFASRYAKGCPANPQAKLRRLKPANADPNRRLRMYADGSEIGATSYTAPGVGSATLKLGSFDDLLNQPPAMRSRCVDLHRSENHLLRVPHANQPREALGPAPSLNRPHFHFPDAAQHSHARLRQHGHDPQGPRL